MLFKKEDKGLLLHEVQVLGLDYTHELGDDFTVQEVKNFILSIKNNKGTVVAKWLRCCATNLKVAGLIPAGAIGIFR